MIYITENNQNRKQRTKRNNITKNKKQHQPKQRNTSTWGITGKSSVLKRDIFTSFFHEKIYCEICCELFKKMMYLINKKKPRN